MKLELTELQEKALTVELAWVKEFNKAGFSNKYGKYKAYIEINGRHHWPEATVMIYQEAFNPLCRVNETFISPGLREWAKPRGHEWKEISGTKLYRKMSELEEKLRDLSEQYDKSGIEKIKGNREK